MKADGSFESRLGKPSKAFKGFMWPRSLGKLPVDVKELLVEVKHPDYVKMWGHRWVWPSRFPCEFV